MKHALSCALALLLLVSGMAAQAGPSLHYERRWPQANPAWFDLTVQADGAAIYRSADRPPSDSASDAEPPFSLRFQLSETTRRQLFQLASQMDSLRSSLDRRKVAFTGDKLLRFEDADGHISELAFRDSSAPLLAAATDRLAGLSETIELGERLRFQLRFDKLSLDLTLRRVEELNSLHLLTEPQLLGPVLTRIAGDASVMNIARQRARRLLAAS